MLTSLKMGRGRNNYFDDKSYETFNLRDPRNLDINICSELKERMSSSIAGRPSQSSASGSFCSNKLQPNHHISHQSVSFKRSNQTTGRNPSSPATFFTYLLRSLSSIDEKSSSTSDVTPNLKPIKSQVYGDLTCQEAAEIIVNSKEQFEMLKYELRVAGVCTTLAAQQLLLQSHLQARFNEIDAQWREEEDNGSAEEVQLSKIDDSMLQPSCPPPSRHSWTPNLRFNRANSKVDESVQTICPASTRFSWTPRSGYIRNCSKWPR
jgi:hypothetical protein